MKKVFSSIVSGFIIQILIVGFLFPAGFVSAVVIDENVCETDTDVVLVLDVSGSMANGEVQSKCEWSELKIYEGNYTWFLNKKYNVSNEWCSNVRDSFDESLPNFVFVFTNYTPSISNKITNAKNAAKSFLNNLKSQDQSAFVTFSDVARLEQQLSSDHEATKSAVDAAVIIGATNIGEAITKAVQELGSERINPKANKIIILLTDGKANKPNGPGYGEYPADVAYAEQKAQEAANLGYKVFTIGLGSKSDINETMLNNIANITGASYHYSPNGSGLSDVYNEIASEMCQYGSISGCKYSDLNNNGIIDASEPKLSGWEIALSGNKTSTQLTDENGCYTFAGLLEGNYAVAEAGNIGKSPFTRTYPFENPYNISLSKGENKTDYNFANYLPVCGNNITDQTQGEQCDDGNIVDEDGCSSTCQTESICGDNTIDQTRGEQCDDGNTVNNDGCSSICQTEQVQPVCGNNLIEQGEQCDDGNTNNGDLCSATCQTEQEQGSVCGNSTIETGEQCDDGNTNNGDLCSATCQTEQEQGSVCGNSTIETGEQCDDGNTDDGDLCSAICQNEVRMQSGDIVINEIMQNPASVSDSYGEWFELYNKTQSDISLLNCTIGDDGGDAHVIYSSLIVPANGYVVLAKNGNSLQNGGVTSNYVYSGFFLSNVSDKIILNCDGIEIDRVEYDGGSQFPNPIGASMSLASLALDNNIGSNWCASTSIFGAGDKGTPGTLNDTCSDIVLPVCGNNTIETGEQCDDGNTANSDGCSSTCQTEQVVTECALGQQRTCSTGGLGICATGNQTCSQFGLWGSCVANNTSINEICNNGSDDDCDGNVDSNDSNCQQASGIRLGDIVINEIMKNPEIVLDDSGEWFEFYNTTSNTFDLYGCTIKDSEGDSFTIDRSVFISPNSYAIFANSNDILRNGGINPDYTYVGMVLSSLPDQIILECNNTEIDRVEYDGGLQFPNPAGASMILKDYLLNNNIGSNWCVSTSPFGLGDFGTPNALNDTCVAEEGPVCGNNTIETGEQCDDGNTTNSDGCSATCQTEQPITECVSGQQRTCSAGGLGICATGNQTCSSAGFWGSCVANNTPISEICNNGLDDDCDGNVDNNDSDCHQSTGGGGGGGFPAEPILLVSDQSITTPNVTDSSITFTWSTNHLSSSYVIYSEEGQSHSLDMTDNTGIPPKYGYAYATVEYDTNPKVLNHSVTITGLKPATTYYFRTVSRGSLAISGEYMTKTVSMQIVPATIEKTTATGGPEQPSTPSEDYNPSALTIENSNSVVETQEESSGEILTETPTTETPIAEIEVQKTENSNPLQAGLIGGFENFLFGNMWLSILLIVTTLAVLAYPVVYFFRKTLKIKKAKIVEKLI
ncbi:MAG: lamin tail domain-containing protein [bacterium]|nr:lamin tail domain-containing protein [bacterium]